MDRKLPARIWLLLGLLAVLFVATLRAPRSWQTIARSTPLTDLAAHRSLGIHSALADQALERLHSELAVFRAPVAPATAARPVAEDLTSQLTAAPYHPPIASDWNMDLQLTDIPPASSKDVIHFEPASNLEQHASMAPSPSSSANLAEAPIAVTEVPVHVVAPTTASLSKQPMAPGIGAVSFAKLAAAISPSMRTAPVAELTDQKAVSAAERPAIAHEPVATSIDTETEVASDTVASDTVASDTVASDTVAWGPATQRVVRDDYFRLPSMVDAAPHLSAERQWVTPVTLLDQLDRLAIECPTSTWANDVIGQLSRLSIVDSDDARSKVLGQLAQSHKDVDNWVASVPTLELRSETLRAQHALGRRLALWQAVQGATQDWRQPIAATHGDAGRLAEAVAELRSQLPTDAAGDAWRAYLQLDALAELAAESNITPISVGAPNRAEVAEKTLARLQSVRLSPTQQVFLQQPAVQGLRQELIRWSRPAITAQQLLQEIEGYEASGSISDARVIAQHHASLEASDVRPELAQSLERFYRNGNLRICVHRNLINRVLPPQQVDRAPVHDTILGAVTDGHSQTATDLSVALIPDENKLRFDLRARGLVNAWTQSTSGVATFASNTNSMFEVRKAFELNMEGVRTSPAQAYVDSTTNLQSAKTDLDPLPIVGLLANEYARSAYHDQQPQAKAITQQKVAQRALSQVDGQTEQRVAIANEFWSSRVLSTLANLGLSPTLIESRTTEDRLTLRARVASVEHLASNTPRPQAPADSELSMQIHQSLVNNMADSLQLNGRSFTLLELREYLVKKIGMKPKDRELPHELKITFAQEDPIVVRMDRGRVELTLQIAELRRADDVYRNLLARVYYRPVIDGLSASLVRDGVVQLRGEGLGTRGQIIVRGMFSKAFPQDPVVLIPAASEDRPILARHVVSQFIFEDGWLGIALSPRNESPATHSSWDARRSCPDWFTFPQLR